MPSDGQFDLLPTAGQPVPDQGIDLLAVVAAFVVEWRLILITWFVVTLVATMITYSLKSLYVAKAVILPQSSRNDSDSLAAVFSPRSPGGVFVGLLKSDTVANDVVDRAGLLAVYKTTSHEAARGRLGGQTTITAGLDSLLSISVRDADAKRAATIANAYLDALEDLNLSMAHSQGQIVEDFFSQQLEQEREALSKAEVQLEQTEKQTGLVLPEVQTQIGLTTIQGLRSQITTLEVQLASLRQSETDENPQVQRLRSQIGQLQAQENSLEAGTHSAPMGAAPPADQLPTNNIDIARAQRDVRFHDQLVGSLASQFEAARLNQDLARPAFQVIDHALVPEGRAWPPRRLFLMAGIVFGLFCGLFAVIAKLTLRRLLSDPANAPSFQAMRQAFVRR